MRSAAAMTFLRIWVEKAESGLLDLDMASAELLTECETRIAAPISARQVESLRMIERLAHLRHFL